MAKAPDDDEVDLGISLVTVATVVDHARALQGDGELDADADNDEDDDELDEEEESSAEAFSEFIDTLNDDERAALVALAWTGRGDYGPEDWAEALALAADRDETGDTAEYLLGMEGVGDLLSEGVAAFGLSLEEVDR
jgi:hypothetical protein